MTPRRGAPALSCAGIRASYGPVQVLFDAGLTVGQGEMVALLGPNGVGKSTLLKVIGGLLRPTPAPSTSAASTSPRWSHPQAGRPRAVPGRRAGDLPVADA